MKKKSKAPKAKKNHKTFLIKMLPKHSIGAEIGVWTGKFTRQVLKIVQPTQYHLIDPWAFMSQYPHRWYGGSRARSQPDMDEIFNTIKQEFGPLPCISIHRTTSTKAAKCFANEYFDWVYIDGDHSFKIVKEDIRKYLPLVKPGGILCGDDWCLDSVRRAVMELLRADYKVHNQSHQWWIKKPNIDYHRTQQALPVI